jgi:CRISPR-associated protein Csb2
MLTIAIEFLTGRYVATRYDDRRAAEWPPHPARVYSAFAATHFESAVDPAAERDALTWLAEQAPPEICYSDAEPREIFDVFVPVNDPSAIPDVSGEAEALDQATSELAVADTDKARAKARTAVGKAEQRYRAALVRATGPADGKLAKEAVKVGASLLPAARGKQPRTFPSVTPVEPRIALRWPHAEPPAAIASALDELAARVVRIGHSSSLVSVRVTTSSEGGPAALIPDEAGREMLRWVPPGQLGELAADFEVHRGTASGRTLPARVVAYRKAEAESATVAPGSEFSSVDWLLFAVNDEPDDRDGAGSLLLPATRGVELSRAVRKALQSFCPVQPPPELLTGHTPDGARSSRSHLAIVPLPFVGHPHADGYLRGVALVFPHDVAPGDRTAIARSIDAWERAARTRDNVVPARLPGGLEVWLRRTPIAPMATLDPRRWSSPSTTWLSVTPVALERHPGDLRSREPEELRAAVAAAEASIVASCRHAGLPDPVSVEILPAAPVAGAAKARAFPAYPPVAGRQRRILTHVALHFAEAVQGPVILGAGRYNGLGLCFPVDGKDGD